MRKKLSLASLACLPLFACGGDSGGSNKTVKVVDAKVFLDGSAAVTCKAPATYANSGSGAFATDHAGSATGSAAHFQVMGSLLNATDYMFIEAFAGDGAWMGVDLSPATVDLATLMTLDPQLVIFPQAAFGSDGTITDDTFYNQGYWAFAGTVQFTSIGGGSGTTFAGTLTGVEFDHALLSTAGAFSDPMDGCKATIASATFTAVVKNGTHAFQGEDDKHFSPSQSALRLQNRHY
jgi:hypothetical protein